MASDATVYQNSDVTLQFTIYSDTLETTVRDLTSYGTPVYRVGSLATDSTTLEVNGSISDAVNGIIQVTLTAAQTGGLSPGKYNHQLTVTDNSGNDDVVTDGYLTVKESLPDV